MHEIEDNCDHARAVNARGTFGRIAPISLIIGIFDHNIRIYETHNTGWWYDLGFYMAVISGFGGLALTRRRRRD